MKRTKISTTLAEITQGKQELNAMSLKDLTTVLSTQDVILITKEHDWCFSKNVDHCSAFLDDITAKVIACYPVPFVKEGSTGTNIKACQNYYTIVVNFFATSLMTEHNSKVWNLSKNKVFQDDDYRNLSVLEANCTNGIELFTIGERDIETFFKKFNVFYS